MIWENHTSYWSAPIWLLCHHLTNLGIFLSWHLNQELALLSSLTRWPFFSCLKPFCLVLHILQHPLHLLLNRCFKSCIFFYTVLWKTKNALCHIWFHVFYEDSFQNALCYSTKSKFSLIGENHRKPIMFRIFSSNPFHWHPSLPWMCPSSEAPSELHRHQHKAWQMLHSHITEHAVSHTGEIPASWCCKDVTLMSQ